MRGRCALLGLFWMASCVPVPKSGTIQPTARFYSIPSTFKNEDLLCLDPNQPGTCATVGEVKQFLVSRRAE